MPTLVMLTEFLAPMVTMLYLHVLRRTTKPSLQQIIFSAVLLHDTPYIPLQYQLQDPEYNPLTEGTQRVSRTINLLAIIALMMSGFFCPKRD